MNILITLKQAGKRRDHITTLPFPLEYSPTTVRELIIQSVHTCVTQYNERVHHGESTSPISDTQLDAMSETGKFAFGINYGQKEVREATAVETALQAFEDGLFRIFLNNEELTNLNSPIQIQENDRVVFIRLTMLSGRMF